MAVDQTTIRAENIEFLGPNGQVILPSSFDVASDGVANYTFPRLVHKNDNGEWIVRTSRDYPVLDKAGNPVPSFTELARFNIDVDWPQNTVMFNGNPLTYGGEYLTWSGDMPIELTEEGEQQTAIAKHLQKIACPPDDECLGAMWAGFERLKFPLNPIIEDDGPQAFTLLNKEDTGTGFTVIPEAGIFDESGTRYDIENFDQGTLVGSWSLDVTAGKLYNHSVGIYAAADTVGIFEMRIMFPDVKTESLIQVEINAEGISFTPLYGVSPAILPVDSFGYYASSHSAQILMPGILVPNGADKILFSVDGGTQGGLSFGPIGVLEVENV